jgi:hypothetical protein
MTTETTTPERTKWRERVIYKGGGADAVYGLGLFGAWFYYVGAAWPDIGAVIIGIIKGIFWPAFLVYEALRSLGI